MIYSTFLHVVETFWSFEMIWLIDIIETLNDELCRAAGALFEKSLRFGVGMSDLLERKITDIFGLYVPTNRPYGIRLDLDASSAKPPPFRSIRIRRKTEQNLLVSDY